jgi:hypothetical protein
VRDTMKKFVLHFVEEIRKYEEFSL